MKFAHLADCHIGSWRDPKLRDANMNAFIKAVDYSIEQNIDFMLISGDLFHTALPSIDWLKQAVRKLKELKDNDIPVYIIAGSHDFSPSGRTMIEVLEKAGLFTNVAKGSVENEKLKLNFIIDKKTGAKITGLLGKKGGLEKEYYKSLDKESLENEPGYKIFMFHSALTEFKSEELSEMYSQPLSFFPKQFNYYAGGHVHEVFFTEDPDYGWITYPGPLFPVNFKELEKLERGGFFIVDVDKGKTNIEFHPLQIHNIHKIIINAENKTPEEVEKDIYSEIKGKEFNNTIVTLRVKGILKSGKPSDIDFKDIFEKLYNKSAYFVMKNTSKLQTREFENIKISTETSDDIEESIIKEHLQQIKVENLDKEKEFSLVKELMLCLNKEKDEGERVMDFQQRVKDDASKILDL